MSEKPISRIAPESWQPPASLWNRMFISVFLMNIILIMAQTMSTSLLAIYADSIGTEASQIGIITSIFALSALAFRFVSGPAMDSFNRKIIIIVAIGLLAVSFFGFSISHSVSALIIFRLLQGIGTAFANACVLAIVADVLPKDKFNKGIGYYLTAQVVVQAIAPYIGLETVRITSYAAMYRITVILLIGSMVATLFIRLRPMAPKKFSMKFDNVIAKEALLPSFLILLLAMVFNSVTGLLILYAEKRGVVEHIGLFFMVYAAAVLLTRVPVDRFTDEFGFAKISSIGIIITAISMVCIGYAQSLGTFLIAAVVNGVGYGAVQPGAQALCMKSVPRTRSGSASATQHIFMDIGTLIGPTIAGFIAQAAGYTPVMWLAMTVPLIIGLVVVIIGRMKIRKIEDQFTESR